MVTVAVRDLRSPDASPGVLSEECGTLWGVTLSDVVLPDDYSALLADLKIKIASAR